MKNLNNIAEDLFNKIRGRFPSVTIGDAEGNVTNVPTDARFFDFDYKESGRSLGKVSITLDEESVSVMYSNDFVANEDQVTQDNWYNFLKELRQFSKKRLMNFDTRNITKSNLNRRDYKFLATNRSGDGTMNESKMYGTSRVSYQDVGEARVLIKHTESIDQTTPGGRTRNIGSIYIESADGERFKYPYKHLSGARAMARHVAEGGKPYDDFGGHITGLSEELSKLRKFKTYMGRSAVMAESLSEYMDVVKERIATVKKTVESLQKPNYYKETVEGFEVPMMEDVPDDVKENWIDELTIKQFNEELADVFPYIYKLVGEATRAKELGPEDLEEAPDYDPDIRSQGSLDKIQGPAGTVKVRQGMTLFSIAQMFNDQNNMGGDVQQFVRDIMELNDISNPQSLQVGQTIQIPYNMGTGPDGASRGLPPSGFTAYEDRIESAFEEMMGQFAEGVEMCPEACCGKPVTECSCGPDCPHCDCYSKNKAMKEAQGHVCEECGNPSWETLGMTEEEIEEGERHGNSKIYDKCWKGYRKVPGKKAGEKGSCKKVEGNAYANAVRQAKMNGKKKGDKIQGPDGDEITLEKEGKTPLGEFILSYFDYTSGQFPKGETAILTMVEKDYGEQFINPAKQFIEKINNRVAEVMGYRDTDIDESGLQYYTGKKKYGKEGMAALAQAGREGASEEELGAIKDKYKKESEDLRRLAGL